MKNFYLKVGIIAFCLFIIDQFSKWLVLNYLGSPLEITPWFRLIFEQNLGIAWSIPIPKEIILPLNIILLIIMVVYLPKAMDYRHKGAIISMALIVGGALGNIYDRFAYGYVVDFISIGWWPIFNLADVFLTIGIFIIMLFYGTIRRRN